MISEIFQAYCFQWCDLGPIASIMFLWLSSVSRVKCWEISENRLRPLPSTAFRIVLFTKLSYNRIIQSTIHPVWKAYTNNTRSNLSTVGIAESVWGLDYGLSGRGSIPYRAGFFYSSQRPDRFGCPQNLLPNGSVVLSPEVKRSGCEADYSSTSSAKVKNENENEPLVVVVVYLTTLFQHLRLYSVDF
jgi:hypothetical protein